MKATFGSTDLSVDSGPFGSLLPSLACRLPDDEPDEGEHCDEKDQEDD
jgi:hypothetical protein